MNENELKNRITGALYGVAVGDAFGAPLEFCSTEEIARKHGRVAEMIGGGWLNVKPGEITDDTQMTLAVAEGIAEEPENPIEAIGERFIAWARSGPKDIGGTCSRSIYGAAGGGKRPPEKAWFAASRNTAIANGNRSGGNGALMRTVYPGLYYRGRLMAVETAVTIAQMTHWNAESNDACEIYTDMIHFITEAEINPPLQDLEQMLDRTRYGVESMHGYELNPTGYVLDSMKCALACFRSTMSFKDAIIKAANLGGDADTITAITGGLAGAFYGYNSIPERWTAALAQDVQKHLDRLADIAFKNRTTK